MVDDVTTTTLSEEDERLLQSLRVQDWQAFHGQSKVKTALTIALQAAKERGEALDHVLLYGPPGLGKTTLSHLVAKEMTANIHISSGTALRKTGDLAAVLTTLEPRDVLFIDEVHRLHTAIEEMLYAAMEDFALDIIIGKGPSARTVRLELPPFTLVGATTKFGSLSGPFRDRFGSVHRLHHYSPEELAVIISQAASTLGVSIDDATAIAIAHRGRGTPRIALKILKRIRDYAQVKKQDISSDIVDAALELHAIDSQGLTETDRYFITQLITKHGGGPVGISTISTTLHEDSVTVEEVIEPYLIELGFLKKTPQGRVVTQKAYQHVGLPYPPQAK